MVNVNKQVWRLSLLRNTIARSKRGIQVTRMASEQERSELDARAKQGETVVTVFPSETGGKSLEAQEHLAEGRHRGRQTRKEQLGTEGYKKLGHRGGETRRSK